MISRRARSELCCTHASLLLDAIPIFHALNPISIVGGSILACGPGARALGATPSLPGLVVLGLDYKNVPGIPVNTTLIFPSRPASLSKPVHSLACRGSLWTLLSLLTRNSRDHSFLLLLFFALASFLVSNSILALSICSWVDHLDPVQSFPFSVRLNYRHDATVASWCIGVDFRRLHWSSVDIFTGSTSSSPAGCQVTVSEHLVERG